MLGLADGLALLFMAWKPALAAHDQPGVKRLFDRIDTAQRPTASAFKAYTPTPAERGVLREIALDVLRKFEPCAGACMMMSCVLAYRLTPRIAGPAIVVQGGLQVQGVQVFEPVEADLSASNMVWDGQAWVMLGDMVVDISIGRTGGLPGSHPALREHV